MAIFAAVYASDFVGRAHLLIVRSVRSCPIEGTHPMTKGPIGMTPTEWPKLYVVKARAADGHGSLNEAQYEEPEYTVSDAPNINGWNVDGGYPGYGLSKEWAERIILAVNSHADMRTALETIRDIIGRCDADDTEAIREAAWRAHIIARAALNEISAANPEKAG